MIKQVGGWWLPLDELHLTQYIEQHGEYQREHRRRALAQLPRGGHAIDCGAHVGTWLGDLCEHFRWVWAIEPRGIHRECLERNMRDQGHTNYTLCSVLAGSGQGQAGLCEYSGNSGHTHWQPQGEIPVIALDTLGVDQCRFIKIDVEGYEYPVIQGLRETIRRDHPRFCIEQKPHPLAEQFGGRYAARDLLKTLGYRARAHKNDDWVLEYAG